MSPPLAALVAALAVSAGPAKDNVIRLAAPGLTLVDVDRARGTFYLDFFCEQLTHQGPIRITTESEVAALVGFERERELLGCSDATKQACFVELANALGVDGLIVGNIAKVGSGFAATIKVVSSRDGDSYGSRSTRVRTEDDLLDWLQQSAKELAPPVVQHRHAGADAAPGNAQGPPARTDAPAEEPPPPSGSPAPTQLRFSALILRVEYARRLWPRVLLGVRAGGPFGLTLLGTSPAISTTYGADLSAVGRYELGPREGLHAELVASLGGGYWHQSFTDSNALAFTGSAGAALAWGNVRLGLEAFLVLPLGSSGVTVHGVAVPELGWSVEF